MHDGNHLLDDGWLIEASMRWTPQRLSCVCLACVCSFVPAFGVASQSWISPARAGYANALLPASNLDPKERAALCAKAICKRTNGEATTQILGRTSSKRFPNPIDVHVGHYIRLQRTLLSLPQETVARRLD